MRPDRGRIHRCYLGVVVTLMAALFAAVWVYVAVCPMCYMDGEYPAALAKHEMVRSCNLGTVTVLGDSRSGVAVVPLLMTVPTSNLSFNGGSPIEAAAVTREMLRCPKLPRLVIVSLDALHLERPDTTLWDRSAYFHLLGVRDLQALLATSMRLHDLSAFAVAGHDGLPDEVRIWLYGAWFHRSTLPRWFAVGWDCGIGPTGPPSRQRSANGATTRMIVGRYPMRSHRMPHLPNSIHCQSSIITLMQCWARSMRMVSTWHCWRCR